MKLVGALLCRNEAGADRYLKRVLKNALSFCDEIVVVDDGSTDETAAICQRAGATVLKHAGEGWWGGGDTQAEAPARKQLWELASKHAGSAGWIYVFDADHLLVGITPTEVRTLLKGTSTDAWACPLWDCWEREEWHRIDGPWQAWRLPRPWLFRALSGEFGTRDIHVGHAPFRNWNVGLMPSGAGIQHLGYVKLQHRIAKRTKYLDLA